MYNTRATSIAAATRNNPVSARYKPTSNNTVTQLYIA
jgi:hypothetical protein